MEIVKLKGTIKNYIWGGERLLSFNKKCDSRPLAESWELSFHPDGPSLIDSGIDKGKYLKDVVTKEDLGTSYNGFSFFPILNKLIDAKSNLSIQVHPSDEYALKNENSLGKTEMWYVVDATENAQLHIGLKENVSKEDFKSKVVDGSIFDSMNHINVKKGDCFFIPAGTLHAIGEGCLVYEIQENSNITYRVFDYNRVDKDGNKRQLHVDKALEVTNLTISHPVNLQDNLLAKCKYFEVRKETNINFIPVCLESFRVITFLEGEGKINDLDYKKGDTFFIPANKEAKITGTNFAIITKI